MFRYSADNNAADEAMFGDLGSPGGAFEVGSIPPAGQGLDKELDQMVCDDEMVDAGPTPELGMMGGPGTLRRGGTGHYVGVRRRS